MKKLIAVIVSCLVFSTNAAVISLDFSSTFTNYGNQFENGVVKTENNGSSLSMNGNNWVAFSGPFVIEKDTVFEITFFSSRIGELHGFGFDSDDVFESASDYRKGANRYFQLAGSQKFGVQKYNTYKDVGTIQTFLVDVGSFITGTFNYLVFINDQDREGLSANSVYSIKASGGNLASVSEPITLYVFLFSLIVLFTSCRLKR